MNEESILEFILDRLGKAEAEALFSSSEVENWPPQLLEIFLNHKLLQPAPAAQALECQGCEENCFMPVDLLPGKSLDSTRAFITCDKRDDISRVFVDLRKLRQWKITGQLVAKTISQLLYFQNPPKSENKGKCWEIGPLKGKKHIGQLVLITDEEKGVFIKVSGHEVPLAEILMFHQENLTLDRNELVRLVDHPSNQNASYKPSHVRRESRKLTTQQMYEDWKKAYRELKRNHPHKPDTWYSMKIAKMEIAKDRDSETIRKKMKK